MKEKFIALLTFTSSLRNFGTKFIRVAILVVFVWIGGLKYFHYEADGIVPFVANSPFMSFFIMTLGTLSFLVTTPEVWVPNLGSGEFGFPLLSGAGRLVIKDIVILAGAVVLLSDSSQRVLKTLKKD